MGIFELIPLIFNGHFTNSFRVTARLKDEVKEAAWGWAYGAWDIMTA
jgi:hypothetical protein